MYNWTGKREMLTSALLISNITLLYLFYTYEKVELQCIDIKQIPCILVNTSEEEMTYTPEYPDWQGCPEPDLMFITSMVDGRLGNLVWEYLSAWAVARRYGLWPVMTEASLQELAKIFEQLSVPALEEVSRRCHLQDLNITKSESYVNSQGELFRYLEVPQPGLLLKFPYYVVNTEELLPWWRNLKRHLRLKPNLKKFAERILIGIRNKIRGPRSNKTSTASAAEPEAAGGLQFVGVHVRRTDYFNHISLVYPGASSADHRFFLSAMRWLREHLKRPLAFIVVSDDPTWCKENLIADDVFVSGTGDADSPGLDMALLAACNHTIFAYGTFGLTAAMLADGGYTLLYDTQNGTNTKEMEFANFLPGWHILDDQGNENHYDPGHQVFPFTYLIKTGL